MTDVSNSIIGEENVVIAEPQMVGEDFARYGSTEEDIPTAMYWLGTVLKKEWINIIQENTPFRHFIRHFIIQILKIP